MLTHNEELHNLYCSPIIRMGIRWAGYAVHMRQMQMEGQH